MRHQFDGTSDGSSTNESSNCVLTKQEKSMSKLVKLALILAVAAVAMAAKQFTAPGTDKVALSLAPAASISPAALTHSAGPLPETKIDSLY
jgi:predicted lysophospholipase L1 biosynthesis ABC-type transport system permease subunit